MHRIMPITGGAGDGIGRQRGRFIQRWWSRAGSRATTICS